MLQHIRMTLTLAVGLLGGLGAAAAAADPATFTLGFPWTTVAQTDPPPASGGTRKLSQWHVSGEADSFTMIEDASGSYADSLALIEKNFSDNHVKPSIDKNFTCSGMTGRMVEFIVGPDGHQVFINRVLLPESPSGLLTFTYVRSDKDWDGSVTKSMKAYCGPSSV